MCADHSTKKEHSGSFGSATVTGSSPEFNLLIFPEGKFYIYKQA